LPHIPDFNTKADIDKSRQMLMQLGVKEFDEFRYITGDKR
jgi:pyruvate formate lyase activating enzyme